jgi:hypothetical protein
MSVSSAGMAHDTDGSEHEELRGLRLEARDGDWGNPGDDWAQYPLDDEPDLVRE